MRDHPAFQQILQDVNGKCAHKVRVMTSAESAFEMLKKESQVLAELLISERDPAAETSVSFKAPSRPQFHLIIGEDALVFNLHEDVFDIEPGHTARKSSYVREDDRRTFCGLISMYNYLASSIEKNRVDDIGYLIGRIFVNADGHFFVEGKKRMGYLFNDFGTQTMAPEPAREIILAAAQQCLETDLQVPPFEAFASLNVLQIQAINGTPNPQMARPLGFHFNKPTDSKE